MVQKNDTIAILISLIVVILVLLCLVYCCSSKTSRTLSDSGSYISGSDPEKGPASPSPGIPRPAPAPTGLDGGFNVRNGRGSRRPSPSHGHDGSFNAGSRRTSRAGTPLRPDGDFNVGSRQNSRRPSRARAPPGTDGDFNIASRQNTRRPSRARESGNRVPIIPNIPHNETFDTPGPSRRDRGILRNDRLTGSRGPSRVAFQPDNGGFNAVEGQRGEDNGSVQVTDGAFNVGNNTSHTVAAGQPAQPSRQGGSEAVRGPGDGSGSEFSGGFNVG